MKKSVLFVCCVLFFHLEIQAQKIGHVQGDVIVQLKPGENIRQLARQLQFFKGQPTQVQVKEEVSPPMRIWLLSFDFANIHEYQFIAEIRRRPEVQVAQVNHLIELRETIPDDPNFGQQWQWVNTGQGGGTPDADVDADLAWDITTGGTTADGHEIVVCVVEGGANRNHPDLQGNLWVNTSEIPANGIDDDANGYVDDYNGWNPGSNNDNIPSAVHGTQVSGMIGAKGNNGQFVSGINWDVKIMHVTYSNLTEASVISSYTYPLVQRRRFNQSGGAQGAFVVATNSSWGIDGGDPADAPLWCAFYDSLGMEGILSCGATANNNVNIDLVLDLPTACPSEFMVAVTATNNSDVRTFSGYGTTHIDVGAPGAAIVTISQNGGPSTTSGTSFASPLTAGIIGLLYSAPCSSIGPQAIADPAGTALLVRDALFSGVDLVPNLVPETKYGGRVNAFNSLLLLMQGCGPCPKPYNVAASNIVDVAADVTWASTDSTLLTHLRYRVLGDTTWTLLDSVASPLALTGLQACTQYEFQLEDLCGDTLSGFTNSFFFETDGCCVAPEYFEVHDVTTTSATASWQPVFAANSYNVQLNGPQGGQLFTGIVGTDFPLSLEPCAGYTVQVQTVCDTGATEFTEPVSFTTLGCGACLDLSYCPSAGLETQYEWIENVTIGTINNTSASENGYGDFTGLSTDLATFTSNVISLTPGFSGGAYPEWFTVWVDFNQDGDFNDSGEKAYDAGSTSEVAVTGNITVPGTAVLGATRMRVIMRWNTAPAGPCSASFNAGEVEDYCVNIVEGSAPNCIVPENVAAANITATAADAAWNAVNDAASYTVRHRPTGTSTWQSAEVLANIVPLTPLDSCRQYEVQVRSNCIGAASGFSPSALFTTQCTSPTHEQPGGLTDVTVLPNPFQEGFTVRFGLPKAQQVRVELVDVCGRAVFAEEVFFAAGENQVAISAAGLPQGVFFVKMTVENGLLVRRVVRS